MPFCMRKSGSKVSLLPAAAGAFTVPGSERGNGLIFHNRFGVVAGGEFTPGGKGKRERGVKAKAGWKYRRMMNNEKVDIFGAFSPGSRLLFHPETWRL